MPPLPLRDPVALFYRQTSADTAWKAHWDVKGGDDGLEHDTHCCSFILAIHDQMDGYTSMDISEPSIPSLSGLRGRNRGARIKSILSQHNAPVSIAKQSSKKRTGGRPRRLLQTSESQHSSICRRSLTYAPLEYETTAHFPLHAHFRAPESPPPPSVARIFSSSPGCSPTTTSALHVRRARTFTPDPGPKGPMASTKGVVGSHCA